MTLPHGKVKGSHFYHEPFGSCYLFILTRQTVPDTALRPILLFEWKMGFSLNDTDSEALKLVLHRGIRQQTQMIGVLVGDFA